MALVSFILMHVSVDLPVDDYMVSVIFIVLFLPVFYVTDNIIVRISIILFMIFQLGVSYDYVINPTTSTLIYSYYEYIALILHLTIILALIREGVVNGINNTFSGDYSNRSNDNQLNFNRKKANSGQQATWAEY